MVLAKAFGMPPRALADIAAKLRAHSRCCVRRDRGPGFINLRLKAAVWPRVLERVLALGDAYGRSTWAAASRPMSNMSRPTRPGPLHVGHCRGAVFGDALAQLLDVAGYEVTREYYINDAGAQVDVLARSAYLRYREALGETIGEIPAGLYPGDYLKPVGAGAGRGVSARRFCACRRRNGCRSSAHKAIAMMMD